MHINQSLHLLLVIFLIIPITLFIFDRFKRKTLFNYFSISQRNTSLHYLFRWLYIISAMISLSLLIITFSGPYSDKEEIKKQQTTGIEILFMVDVSRSMLAEDVVPSRLEKVKSEIINYASNNRGDRYGLIAFAGEAILKCPMTTDSWFFIKTVKQLQAGSVARGSTSIASALNLSQKMMPQGETGVKVRTLVVFTDGENHEINPIPAAQAVEKAGGRLFFIAIGNNKRGARIPIIDDQGNKKYLTYKGQEVWSKTDLTTLKRITESCQKSALLPALDGSFDLEKHINSFTLKVGNKQKVIGQEETKIKVNYQITPFIIFSLLFLILARLFLEISRKKGQHND